MRLLIITQKVDIDDDNLSFFHRWIEKFSERLEEVYVICLSVGEHDLPDNVHIFSMGREKGMPKIGQLFLLQRYLMKILPRVDGAFVHMCPIYAIASFPLVKIFRKKMILWFLHKNVGWKLKLAEKFVDKIITASEKSCRLKNRRKIKIIGHGIDTEMFKPRNGKVNDKFIIFSAGRINPSKDLATLINAVDILVNQKGIIDLEVRIAGNPITQLENKYFSDIKILVHNRGLDSKIRFLGSIPNYKMPEYYQNSDVFINLSHTGSVDKVVLEAMACGIPVLTCNEAFQEILDKIYIFDKKDYKDLAEKIVNLKDARKNPSLREIVLKNHNLDNLIDKIITEFHVQH